VVTYLVCPDSSEKDALDSVFRAEHKRHGESFKIRAYIFEAFRGNHTDRVFGLMFFKRLDEAFMFGAI